MADKNYLNGIVNELCIGKSLEQRHPLIPKDVVIKNYIIDSKTGKLTAFE